MVDSNKFIKIMAIIIIIIAVGILIIKLVLLGFGLPVADTCFIKARDLLANIGVFHMVNIIVVVDRLVLYLEEKHFVLIFKEEFLLENLVDYIEDIIKDYKFN